MLERIILLQLKSLIFNHLIYPRGLSTGDINQVKPDVENVDDIVEGLEKGTLNHKITYNTKTMDIVDGTHLWLALRRLHGDDWEVPTKFLNNITIDPEAEMLYAVHYNSIHGLKLSRADKKAVLANYIDEKTGKVKYGQLKDIEQLWGMSINTLKQWIEDIKYGPREMVGSAHHSEEEMDKAVHDSAELKLKISHLEGIIETTNAREKEKDGKIEDLQNDNNKRNERIKKLEEQLENIPKRCPKCKAKVW